MRPKAIPPDGGWGWMIVACAFINQFLCVGTSLSLGILYIYWLDEFDEDKALTSWILSTTFFLMCVIGPLPASLAEKYGFRVVTVIGGFLMSLGFFISSFATSVIFLIVSVGILAGAGMGFIYLASFATVSLYFEKRRTLANGVGTSGAGIGSFVLPLLMKELEEMYGWRGALWVLSALMLHVCATGLLLRPLEDGKGSYSKIEITSSSTAGTGQSTDSDSPLPEIALQNESLLGNAAENDAGEMAAMEYNELVKSNDTDTDCTQQTDTPSSIPLPKDGNTHSTSKPMSSHLSLSANDHCVKSSSSPQNPYKSLSSVVYRNIVKPYEFGSLPHVIASTAAAQTGDQLHKGNAFSSINNMNLDRRKGQIHRCDLTDSIVAKSLQNIDIKVLGSMPSLFHTILYNSSSIIDPVSAPITSSHKDVNQTVVVEDIFGNRVDDINGGIMDDPTPTTIKETLFEYLQLLKDKGFITFGTSIFLLNVGITICLVFVGDRVVDEGLGTSVGALVLSFNGIGNVIGRLFFGLMADRLFKDHVMCFMLIIGIMAASTLLSMLCGTHAALHLVYAILLGITMGGHVVLMIGVTVALIGLDRATLALGLALVFAGIGCLIGPPFGGWLYDMTRSYLVSYLVAGILLLVSTLILIPIRKK